MGVIREDSVKIKFDVDCAGLTSATSGMDAFKASVTGGMNDALSGMKNVAGSSKSAASGLEQVAAAADKVDAASPEGLSDSLKQTQQDAQSTTRNLTDMVKSLKSAMKVKVSSALEKLKSIPENAKNKFDRLKSSIGSLKDANLSDIGKGLDKALGKAVTAASNLLSKLKQVAGVSLSKVGSGLSKLASGAGKATSVVGKGALSLAKGIATGVGAATTAIGGAVAASVKVGMGFEAGMSSVAAISGATGEEISALTAKAKEMGAKTVFSASESASAMEYMAMAGWKSADMIGGIEGIMNLAAASGADLAQTSDIVTDGLTAFGMAANESGRFADVMAAASANANTNVEMMGETFKYVGSAAGAMGYSIEDMAVATGLMANSGIKGSQAGTALRSTITRLAKPTKESQTAMDALGMSITRSDGSMKSFGEVMTDMRSGMQGMTEDQKASYAAMLGGQEAMSGLLAIANASDEDFNKLTNAIGNSAGAAERMAGVKLDNLQGDVTLLKSSMEGLGIEIYEGINAPLRSAAQGATEMVNNLTSAFQSGGFSGLADALGSTLAQVITQLSAMAPQAIQIGVQLIQSLLSGIQANSGSIAAGAASVITSLVSGIIALAPQLITTGLSLITQLAAGLAQSAPQLAASAAVAIQQIVQGLTANAPSLISSAQTIITSFLGGLVSAAPTLIQGGMVLVAQLISGVAQLLPQLIPLGIQLIFALLQGFVSGMGSIGEAVGQLATQIIGAIFTTDWLSVGMQIIGSLASGIWEGIKGLGKGIWEGIKSWFTGDGELTEEGAKAAESFASGVESAGPQVYSASDFVGNTAVQGFDANASLLQTTGNLYAANFETSLLSGKNSILQAGMTLGAAAPHGLNESAPAMVSAADNLTNSLMDTLNASAGTIAQASGQIGTEATSAIDSNLLSGLSTAQSTAQTGGEQVLQAMGLGIDSGATQIQSTIDTLTQTISEQMSQCWTTIGSDASSAWSELGTQISTAFSDIGSNVTLGMESIQTSVSASLEETTTTVTTGMAATTTEITAGMSASQTSVTTGMSAINAAVFSGITMLIAAMVAGMAMFVAAVTTGGSQAVASANSTAMGIYSAFASINLYGAGVNMMSGLVAGIQSMAGAVMAAAANVASAAAAAVNSALKIHSPSRVMIESGQYTGEGLIVGMENMKKTVGMAAQGLTSEIVPDRAESQSEYTPATTSCSHTSSRVSNTYSPQFTLNLNGASATETNKRTIKRWVQEAFEECIEGMSRKNPALTEV